VARTVYGASLGDYAIDSSGRPRGGATFDVWDSLVGGSQVTDLKDADENPTTVATSDDTGFIRLYGPDGWGGDLYAEDVNGSRFVLRPTDLTQRVAAAHTATLGALALTPEAIAVGDLTVNPSGAVVAASVVWPDGATGTYTADATSGGAVDAYHVTHVLDGVTTTYTQPAVTRDGGGNIVARPAMVVS
jgi:hypothetical protein